MGNTKKHIQLLEAVTNSTKSIGIDNTISILKKSHYTHAGNQEKLIEIIVDAVVDVFRTSRNNIYKTKTRGVRPNCIGACAAMFKKHLSWTYREIADHFKYLEESVIHKYHCRFTKPDVKIKAERELFDNLVLIDERISTYIKQIQNEQRKTE